MLEIMNKGLDELLANDVVEPSNSPWVSPILLVKKPDGTYRWVVDMRKLNKVTKSDAYPLPRVQFILDQLKRAKFISSVDIKSAYFQIKLDSVSKEKTGFIVPGRGLFQFKRMPQGLKTSAATWQRLIDRVIGEDLKSFVFVYLDDVVVISESFEHHLWLLEQVFDRLEKAGLTVNLDKCQLVREELRYLGYVVNQYGLQVDPDKVKSIAEFKRPTTVKKAREFIGLCSWYRRFVEDFPVSWLLFMLSLVKEKNLSGMMRVRKLFERLKKS